MLELPQAVHNLSPFEHAAEMPLESFALTPIVVLTLIAVGLSTIALLAFRRRDLTTT